MKIKTEIRSQKPEAGNPASGLRLPPSERGFALVITLILLSVTLVMAVAFLFISRREQGSVTTETDAAAARLAADSALVHAEEEIVANMLASGRPEPYNFGLLVSTNYLTPVANTTTDWAGLFMDPRLPVFVPTNKLGSNEFRYYLDLNRNGDYDPNGFAVLRDNNNNNIGTNFNAHGDPEWIGILEKPDQFHGPNNKGVGRYAFIAIPIGNALDLNAVHNQAHRGLPAPLNSVVNPPGGTPGSHDDIFVRNESVGSWEINFAAFLADLNTNRWGQIIDNPGWYSYQDVPPYNHGNAFDNAREVFAFRYANDFNTLQVPQNLFPNNAVVFGADLIDGYTYSTPFMTGFQMPNDNDAALLLTRTPWVGADNTNQFFDLPADLYDQARTASGVSQADVTARRDFTSRLEDAGTAVSTYDRTTFYRLLEQIGTDSEAESAMINVNYSNALVRFDANGVATNMTILPGAETNFTPWNPVQFFTLAADRLLHTYTARWSTTYITNNLGFVLPVVSTNFVATFHVSGSFGITNIPVLVSNRFVYTPGVNRLLQMAANIYDATTTNFYPTVFRPIFYSVLDSGTTNVFICGYEQVKGVPTPIDLSKPPVDRPVEITSTNLDPGFIQGVGVVHTNVNVYGVPWIIGAKKHMPNFNEFAVETAIHVERKLELFRNTNTVPAHVTMTNQMYVMNISNWLGVECWNSYSNSYVSPFAITICAQDYAHLDLTNDAGYRNFQILLWSNSITFNPWTGSGASLRFGGNPNGNSFKIPLDVAFQDITNSVYYYGPGSVLVSNISYTGPAFIPQVYDPSNYLDLDIRPFPHFGLMITNRLQTIILDGTNVIDYVQLGGLDDAIDIYSKMGDGDDGFWSTNFTGGPHGVINQIHYSEGTVTLPVDDGDAGIKWNTTVNLPGLGTTVGAQQAYFRAFLAGNGKASYRVGTNAFTVTNWLSSMQAPAAVSRNIVGYTSWQANDPLVHYLGGDLTYSGQDGGFVSGQSQRGSATELTNLNLAAVNDRYAPWGQSRQTAANVDPNPYNLAFKDPLVWDSDGWNFPTNKVPSIGWMGRIHRGTPWQSVYLKATNILVLNEPFSPLARGFDTWRDWTGNGIAFDQTNTAPMEDRILFDCVNSAFNDNATRGQLSVNVGTAPGSHSLAAWSAVLGGMALPPASLTNTSTFIDPAGPYDPTLPIAQQPALVQVVQGINQARAIFTNLDGSVGVFQHKGDILATPQLSDHSPFLNRSQTNYNNDVMYEWLPQQMMSLLRVGSTPRYVIYCYGQALRPAPNGVFLGTTALPSGQSLFGMVTNYQVVAESAARAVVRIEGAPTNTHAVVESFNLLPPD